MYRNYVVKSLLRVTDASMTSGTDYRQNSNTGSMLTMMFGKLIADHT